MTVQISVTSQSFRVKVTPGGQLIDTPVSVQQMLQPFITQYFDRRLRRYMVGKRYRYYNADTQTLYLPRYYLKEFLGYLERCSVDYQVRELKPPKGKSASFKMIDGFKPKNDRQRDAINHLSTCKDAVKGIALQTGMGKSVTTLAHLANAGVRAMIGVQGLTEQWEQAAYQWTDLTEDDVFIIKGGPSVVKLLSRIDKSLFPKVIIYSIGTLRAYSQDSDQYANYPSFDELAKILDVGIRVIDEGHLNFYTNYIMDLRLNVAETIVLTATFDVTDPTVKKIFDGHYPQDMRFGERHYKRYVNIYAYGYRSGHGDIPPFAYQGKDGYSQVKLEKWLLHPKREGKLKWIVRAVYIPIITSHYINKRMKGQKLLVLCEMVEMCEYIAKMLRAEYPELVTNIYVGETEDEVLEFSDIIVSTTRSSGTARDIKKLFKVLQTSSIRSAPQNIQNLGRLREIMEEEYEGQVPGFIYVYNKAISKHIDHHRVRQDLFQSRAKDFKIIDLHP